MGLYSLFWVVVILLVSASSVHGSDGFPGLLDSVHGSDGLPGLLGSVHGSDGLPGIARLCPWQRWLAWDCSAQSMAAMACLGCSAQSMAAMYAQACLGCLTVPHSCWDGVSSPDASCCKSLKWLRQHAMKKGDKRELCKCLKVEDLKHKGVILDRARNTPSPVQSQAPCAARA
ncbi:hypothetical protein OIU76_025997 [Salix suchowensis]|nr:hypothetical protein OIU76_025997 [Salix suchowensis]